MGDGGRMLKSNWSLLFVATYRLISKSKGSLWTDDDCGCCRELMKAV